MLEAGEPQLTDGLNHRDLQHQLRCHKEDGSIRTGELEKTIKTLSSKSDLHKRVASLGAELSALKVSEQRLLIDVDFYKEKAAMLSEAVQAAEEKLSALNTRYGAPGAPSGGKNDLLITTMSEQIEKQAVEVQRLEGLLRAAKEEHDRTQAASAEERRRHEEQMNALQLLSGAHERRVAHLQTEVLQLEEAVRVGAARSEQVTSDLRRSDTVRAAADKAAEVLKDKLVRAEEASVEARSAVMEHVHNLTTRHTAELAELQRKATDSRQELEQALLECQQLLAERKEKDGQLNALEKERQRVDIIRQNAELEAREADGRLRAAQDVAQRENERVQINLTNTSAQLSVLMETIEALQGDGQAEQQVSNLIVSVSTAKVAAPPTFASCHPPRACNECRTACRTIITAARVSVTAAATAFGCMPHCVSAVRRDWRAATVRGGRRRRCRGWRGAVCSPQPRRRLWLLQVR